MKTPLKKLQKFAAIKHGKRSQKQYQSLVQDELVRATQDMGDMKDCYDRFLSAAAATVNSAYEFSESLREMGDCLLEITALNDDEESGKVLLMLGKVQFELQKLVDRYRSHIMQTVSIPSESLLNELHIVEEMKKRCDEKRQIYEDLMEKQKEKGRIRNSKGECMFGPQLQDAREEYDEVANVFVFRMKSLKQGQCRSFLTQASRHHAAQLYFFKKALRSLETIEPHVRSLAEQLHIDYHLTGLKNDGQENYGDDNEDDDNDDGSEADENTEDGSETHDDGELSFDYAQNDLMQDASTLNKMELDNTDATSSHSSKLSNTKDINIGRNSFSFQRGIRAISKSAPLFPENKPDSAERMAKMRPSPSHRFTSYVLPTPDEAKSPVSTTIYDAHQMKQAGQNLQHSPPLDQNKQDKLRANEKLFGPGISETQSVLKESNNTPKASPLPPPLAESLSFKQADPNLSSDAKKAKRQAFSGPLTGKSWKNNPNFTASGPIGSSAYPPPYSGSLLHTPVPRASSTPRISSRVSLSMASSPKISELHELPLPPGHFSVKGSSKRITHSGPLIPKSRNLSTASVLVTSTAASSLPVPPQGLSRSYSIPAGGQTDVALCFSLEDPPNLMKAKDVSSPPHHHG